MGMYYLALIETISKKLRHDCSMPFLADMILKRGILVAKLDLKWYNYHTQNTKVFKMKDYIENIKNEIADIKEILEHKANRLLDATKELHKIETTLYPLDKFINQEYIFDKPYKWSKPKTNTFTENKLENFKYLKFNGLYSGDELNAIYDDSYNKPDIKFEEDQQYVTFSIPDEDFEEYSSQQPIPLCYIHELLAFKLTEENNHNICLDLN